MYKFTGNKFNPVKKIVLLILALAPVFLFAQKPDSRSQRKAERKERVKLLQKQAEEGAIVFARQTAFGIKLNTDGYGVFLELGRMKVLRKADLYWLEIGERKHAKEERIPTDLTFNFGSPYIFGKINNFYYAKLGYGKQVTVGSKGNKNGIAVSAIYGGGISAGLLKPYYIKIQDASGINRNVKYGDTTSKYFTDPTAILGGMPLKGFGEMQFVPGVHLRTAFRFDYGRYNDLLSALEIGLNAEFYSKKMPILLMNKEKRFFFNAYAALTFGRRN
ncbi:MAG: hypothetical protein K0Q66_738 [Chitinophagaceae bacterium]|nr:hypothetical protein [Chitinophagaceae bacterium]